MHLSIIKVHGLSMAPFFQSNDLLLVKDIKDNEPLPIGSCIVQNGLAHRLVTNSLIKGDRLMYFDIDQLDCSKGKVVLGRLISKEGQDIFSMHSHPTLKFISFTISLFSRTNREKHPLRKFSLFMIIVFSKLHRSLEPRFIQEQILQEIA